MRRVAAIVVAIGLLCGIVATGTPVGARPEHEAISASVSHPSRGAPSLGRGRAGETTHGWGRMVDGPEPTSPQLVSGVALSGVVVDLVASRLAVGFGDRALARAPPR